MFIASSTDTQSRRQVGSYLTLNSAPRPPSLTGVELSQSAKAATNAKVNKGESLVLFIAEDELSLA